MAERKSRRPLVILGAIAALVLALIVLAIASFVAAERRLRDFCAGIQAGVQWPGLAMAAGARGLHVSPPAELRPALVTDPSTFGRYVCSIDVGPDGRVGASRYRFND